MVRGPSEGPTVESVFLLSEVSDIGLKSKGPTIEALHKPPPPETLLRLCARLCDEATVIIIIEKTDAGLNGLYIRDINVLYDFINQLGL